MGQKRSRSRSREPPAPAARRRPPCPTGRSTPSEPKETRSVPAKFGFISARPTGRLRGPAVRRPSTPPPSDRAAFRASPSPEPAEEQPAAPTSPAAKRCRDGVWRREKAIYLVMQEHPTGHGRGRGVVSGYAVHRVGLAGSRHGVSVSGEEFEEPPVARFEAAPGMTFLKAGSRKVVGVTDRDAGAVQAESVVIDAVTWRMSIGPPPSSTEHGIVEVSGRIYAAEMFTEDPRCEVLRSASDASYAAEDPPCEALLSAVDASAGRWSPLPRPPFRDRILTLAAYPPCRGLLVSTDKGETYLLDRRRRGRSAWVALPGSAPLPFADRAVYAKDHGLWFELSPADGHLRAYDLDVVLGAGAPKLEHATHQVSDPIPVIAPRPRGPSPQSAKLVYLGGGNFCVAQATAERDGATGDGCSVTVTVFRVIDSEMPAALAERRRRRREHGMNARWVAAELERACSSDRAPASGRGRRKLCRVNLWSRTYIACGGASHGPSLAGVLWM